MIYGQASFLDPVSLAEGERRRDEGTARVLYNTSEDWSAAFERELVRQMRSGRRRFTSEDIVSVVGLPPGHRNAIGAVMRACAVATT